MSARTSRLSSPVSTQAASAASLTSRDELARRPIGIHRTDDAGSTAGKGREDEECRRLHLEVHDALARHLLREVRVADGQLRDRAPLRAEEARSRGRHPNVVAVTQPGRRFDQGRDRLIVGDRGVPIVDEEARGRLEADGSGRDGEVAELHLRLECPAGPDPDEGRAGRDGQDLRHHDLDVVSSDASGHDRDAFTAIPARDRGELSMPMLQLDRIESRRDSGGSVGVTGEEDVLGQVARAESDVVLPFSGWDRDPAIRRAFDAGIRVRQDRSSRSGCCSARTKLGRG